MPASSSPPTRKPGLEYRQEYYKGEAEDAAKVLSLDATAKVPFGTFENCLKTEDTTPLEPDVVEYKYYARNVGPVLRTNAEGGGREELVSFTEVSRGRAAPTSPSRPTA